MEILENVPLAPLTTLKIGGPARYFAEAQSVPHIQHALQFARSQNLAVVVLGGGSNVVVSDSGFPGLVLKIAITGIDQRLENGLAVFEVGAGEVWDAFVARAVGNNCAGVECLSGIPGSVGGTPVQNVGAYGQEVSQVIASVLVFDTRDNQLHEFCNEACDFSYRTSIFNTTETGRYIIVRVTYELTPGAEPQIRYADLQRYFAGWSTPPTLRETREAVRQIRARKAMLIREGDEDSRSAGSFFKNPVLSAEQFDDLTQRAASKGLQIPSYPTLESQRKISAAWLVEHSGFSKGYSKGRVAISRKHALALVNRGGATAAEVIALKHEIQKNVADRWGIQLRPEPVFVGF